jgi:hypothetical protein
MRYVISAIMQQCWNNKMTCCFMLVPVLLNGHHCSNWQGNNYIVSVDSAVGPLHHVDVGDVANVSEMYAASIFKVEGSSCIYRFWSNSSTKGGKGGGLVSSPDQ